MDRAPAKDTPRCEVKGCRQYFQRGFYGRGRGFMQVEDHYGAQRWICQACFQRIADTRRISYLSQLQDIPDSIPWIVAQQENEKQRQQRHDAERDDDMAWMAAHDNTT